MAHPRPSRRTSLSHPRFHPEPSTLLNNLLRSRTRANPASRQPDQWGGKSSAEYGFLVSWGLHITGRLRQAGPVTPGMQPETLSRGSVQAGLFGFLFMRSGQFGHHSEETL